MNEKDKELINIFQNIIDLTGFDELYHDGINIDIRELATLGINKVKGKTVNGSKS